MGQVLQNGTVKIIAKNNANGIGGAVIIGPVDVDNCCSREILELAIKKRQRNVKHLDNH